MRSTASPVAMVFAVAFGSTLVFADRRPFESHADWSVAQDVLKCDLDDGAVTEPLGGRPAASPPAFDGDIFFVNGRETDCTKAMQQAKATGDKLGQGVRLVYNDLTMPGIDDIAIAWDKLFNADVSLNAATKSLMREIRTRIESGRRVAIIAYSGGSIVTNNAVRAIAAGFDKLDAAERKARLGRIHILTVGSAVLKDDHPLADGWPTGLGSVFHLYHKRDPVSGAFGPGSVDAAVDGDPKTHDYLDRYVKSITTRQLSESGTLALQ